MPRKVERRYSDKFDRARTDDARAKISAQQSIKNPHIKVTRRRYPKKYLRRVERDLGARFEIKPKVYIYSLKKGKKFNKRKPGDHLGLSTMHLDTKIEDGGIVYNPTDPYIILPKSHLKDDKIYKTVLIHELAESLALQERYKMPTTHQQALKVERKLEKELGTKRENIEKKANELWNDPNAWK